MLFLFICTFQLFIFRKISLFRNYTFQRILIHHLWLNYCFSIKLLYFMNAYTIGFCCEKNNTLNNYYYYKHFIRIIVLAVSIFKWELVTLYNTHTSARILKFSKYHRVSVFTWDVHLATNTLYHSNHFNNAFAIFKEI